MNMNMNEFEEFKKKHININKFLFIWKEPNLHNKAFFNKINLKAGALLVNIINLLFAAIQVVNSFEKYTFSLFITNFPSGTLLIAGSVLLLLSIDRLNTKQAYWGYMLTAASFWVQLILLALVMIISFFTSPTAFFKSLIFNIIYLAITLVISLYFAWVDYCYVKHLTEGNYNIIETGKGERLSDKEENAGAGASNVNTNTNLNAEVSLA